MDGDTADSSVAGGGSGFVQKVGWQWIRIERVSGVGKGRWRWSQERGMRMEV